MAWHLRLGSYACSTGTAPAMPAQPSPTHMLMSSHRPCVHVAHVSTLPCVSTLSLQVWGPCGDRFRHQEPVPGAGGHLPGGGRRRPLEGQRAQHHQGGQDGSVGKCGVEGAWQGKCGRKGQGMWVPSCSCKATSAASRLASCNSSNWPQAVSH